MAQRLISIPAGSVPQFDELYVISDLHLGGLPGFQIFNSGAELQRLINYLRALPSEKTIALLINGDFVDFLAESPSRHFDPVDAVVKLDRIVQDSAFAPVWKALQKFTGTKNRCLIINLGNHDLELALPWLRAHLLKVLSNGNEAARGRIILAFDGTGFLCRVGGAEVLCVHDNEVDDWNLADYETIRRIGRDIVQGRPVESWIPNAGSQLVIEVMNDLKRSYPFIDLLKPEMQAVVPTLLALAPDQHDKLHAIGATVRRLVWDKLKRATGFLDSDDGSLTGRLASLANITPVPGPGPRNISRSGVVDFGSRKYADALLEETEQRLSRNVDPLSLISSDERGEYLGLSSAVMRLFRGEDTSEVLRQALEKLRQDRSFDLQEEDETYTSLDEQMGDGTAFVVAGHTHLARALPWKKGRGWYFNSGTWARLIKLEKHVLESKEQFTQVFHAFKAGTMEALEALPKLVMRQLTVVAIWSEGASTHGELRRTGPAPEAPILSAIPHSRFTSS
jgi:UDP-2,3-diacylglucosamine pyrophosphatase LpxH